MIQLIMNADETGASSILLPSFVYTILPDCYSLGIFFLWCM